MLSWKIAIIPWSVALGICAFVFAILMLTGTASADDSNACESETKRNGYFDGRFLAAKDLRDEQTYSNGSSSTRNSYFDGRLLTANDFQIEQKYFLSHPCLYIVKVAN